MNLLQKLFQKITKVIPIRIDPSSLQFRLTFGITIIFILALSTILRKFKREIFAPDLCVPKTAGRRTRVRVALRLSAYAFQIATILRKAVLSSLTVWISWEMKQFVISTEPHSDISYKYTRLLVFTHSLRAMSFFVLATNVWWSAWEVGLQFGQKQGKAALLL